MAIRKYALILVGTLLTRLALGGPTSSASAVAAIPTFSAADIDSGKALKDLSKLAYDNAMARVAKATTGCTKDKVKFRKEWWVVFTSLREPGGTALTNESCETGEI